MLSALETAPLEVRKPIKARYLLVATCCPCYVDVSGQRYVDPLWAKDLALHTKYIEDLTLAAPRIDGEPPASFVPWELWSLQSIQLIDLPPLKDFRAALTRLPALITILWTAIGRADVVHAGVNGWPIPDGWIAVPLARLRQKFVIVVVESDFWRISQGQVASLKKKCRAAFSEILNRWCVNMVHVAFFTHEQYLRTLLTRRKERGHLFQASWVDDSFVDLESEAKSRWERKLASRKALRLVFAGRLTADKGINVLLEALETVHSPPGEISCDILGEGPLKALCQSTAERLKGRIDMKLLGTVDYGWPLFNLLAEYDAIVVPSLSNEQPKIVYDGFARAIPAIGSSTDGLASCIEDGTTGRLCRKGSPSQLVELIEWARSNRGELARMGMAGLSVARSLTHGEMHRRRCDVLAPMITAFVGRPARAS